AGKSVTRAEVAAWVRTMTERFKPPFDWETLCEFKQTTPDRERERWRRVQAWKRVTRWQADEKELEGFVAKNKDHFLGFHRLRSTDRDAEPLKNSEYREWIIDEFETGKMNAWLSDLRSHAKTETAPDDELLKLKQLRFADSRPR